MRRSLALRQLRSPSNGSRVVAAGPKSPSSRPAPSLAVTTLSQSTWNLEQRSIPRNQTRAFSQSSSMEAKCNCGAVTVKVTDPELYTKRRGHICHCMNCRRTAGSAFATNLIIEQDKVKIDGAENLSVYNDPDSLSGRTVRRFFCKTCGNPIKSETDPASQAGKVILKLGIFEKIPDPEFETFVDKSVPWVERHEGTTRFKIAMGGEKAE